MHTPPLLTDTFRRQALIILNMSGFGIFLRIVTGWKWLMILKWPSLKKMAQFNWREGFVFHGWEGGFPFSPEGQNQKRMYPQSPQQCSYCITISLRMKLTLGMVEVNQRWKKPGSLGTSWVSLKTFLHISAIIWNHKLP